ncbi:MAG: hemD [Burkholderiaceae bacterium]|nr:hemD [Burkholderiaceae bacterium]
MPWPLGLRPNQPHNRSTMRPVLLTRPLPCSQQLQTQLEQAGLSVAHLPTLALNPMSRPEHEAQIQNQWHDYTGVIFVSQHAAQFAFEHMQRLGLNFSQNTWLGTVGQGTLATLTSLWPTHTSFIAPDVNDSQDSEGLWRAITTSTNLADQRLLIVRAQTGRDVLRQMAQTADIPCDIWACYTRQTSVWSAEQMTQFQQFDAQPGLMVITSIDGLNALLAQFDSKPPPKNLYQHSLITLHPRIAEFAKNAGFNDVRLCPVADLARQIPIWAQS